MQIRETPGVFVAPTWLETRTCPQPIVNQFNHGAQPINVIPPPLMHSLDIYLLQSFSSLAFLCFGMQLLYTQLENHWRRSRYLFQSKSLQCLPLHLSICLMRFSPISKIMQGFKMNESKILRKMNQASANSRKQFYHQTKKYETITVYLLKQLS